MGLDMYLNKTTYIGANYKHSNVTGKVDIKIDGKPVGIKFNRITYITESVWYWRKANHIHKWFVDNVQDGEDNCAEYYVGKEQLANLLEVCKTVVNKPELAEVELPCQDGFFFGSNQYDEYYIKQCKDTIEIIEDIIKSGDADNGEIYYCSSW